MRAAAAAEPDSLSLSSVPGPTRGDRSPVPGRRRMRDRSRFQRPRKWAVSRMPVATPRHEASHLPTAEDAGGPVDPLLPGLRSRHHPPARRGAARRDAPGSADDRRRLGRVQRVRLRLPCGRLRRVAPRPGAGGRDRRPPRPAGRLRLHLSGRRRPGRDRDGRDRPCGGPRRTDQRHLRQQRHLRHDRRPDGPHDAPRPAHDLEPGRA